MTATPMMSENLARACRGPDSDAALGGWLRGSWSTARAAQIAHGIQVATPPATRRVQQLPDTLAIAVERTTQAYRYPWNTDAPEVVNQHARRYHAAAWYPRARVLTGWAYGHIHVYVLIGRTLTLTQSIPVHWVDSVKHVLALMADAAADENLGNPGTPMVHSDSDVLTGPMRVRR